MSETRRGNVIRKRWITREMVRANPNKLFAFGDNMEHRGRGGQAAAMRDEPNAVGVPTKWRPGRAKQDYFTEADADDIRVRDEIMAAFRRMEQALNEGMDVIIPENGFGTGLSELDKRAPGLLTIINMFIEDLSEDFR